MEGSKIKQLQRLIGEALELSDERQVRKVAEKIYVSDEKLVTEWALDRLALMVQTALRGEQKRTAPPSPYQMFLTGFAGLEARIQIKNRGRMRIGDATIMDLRKNLKSMRNRDGQRAMPTRSLISGMQWYSRVLRSLTVERYCELKAAGVTVEEFERQNGKPI